MELQRHFRYVQIILDYSLLSVPTKHWILPLVETGYVTTGSLVSAVSHPPCELNPTFPGEGQDCWHHAAKEVNICISGPGDIRGRCSLFLSRRMERAGRVAEGAVLGRDEGELRAGHFIR